MKKQIFFLFVFLISTSAHAGEFAVRGTYQQGKLSLKPKTQSTLKWDGASLIVTPDTQPPVLKLAIKEIRGATPVATGVWIYWFAADGNTLEAFFKTTVDDATLAASTLNQDVTNFNQRPLQEEKKVQENYEAYRDQALKEAK